MGDKLGFIKYSRENPSTRPAAERIKDYKEIYEPFEPKKLNQQAARCMDCGIPFCHKGCPLGNVIPEFNEAVHSNDWEDAYEILKSTNNFPEFTGRICPAPCEASCVLNINKDPVAIELIEKNIAEKAYELGLVKASPPELRSGKSIAVVGSGPAGLAAADQLNHAGHQVTVYERGAKVGGLLRYGIPDFKMEKWIIDRRIQVMEDEGVTFTTNTEVGKDITADELKENYDAVVLCVGATQPRNLPVPGNDLKGVYFAMSFLGEQNKVVSGEIAKHPISAKDKRVVVIGGGDTGSDCIGTSNRHGAKSILQLELLPQPPTTREQQNPWPEWPMTLRSSSSHEEGGDRAWSVMTKAFQGNEKGELTGITLVDLTWEAKEGKKVFSEVKGSERTIPCDLVFLAIGYVGPEENGLLENFGVAISDNKLPKTKAYQSANPNVFLAGDARRGQSLVVWAIAEGREAAAQVDEYLLGQSALEKRDYSKFENPASW